MLNIRLDKKSIVVHVLKDGQKDKERDVQDVIEGFIKISILDPTTAKIVLKVIIIGYDSLPTANHVLQDMLCLQLGIMDANHV